MRILVYIDKTFKLREALERKLRAGDVKLVNGKERGRSRYCSSRGSSKARRSLNTDAPRISIVTRHDGISRIEV